MSLDQPIERIYWVNKMGTNYYLQPVVERCPTCHKPTDDWNLEFAKRHIGKSSYGWCFSLRVYPENGVKDLEDWIERWGKEGFEIRDGSDELVTPEEMLKIITERTFPGGLKRHESGVGSWPGEGTWDCCNYEFC